MRRKRLLAATALFVCLLTWLALWAVDAGLSFLVIATMVSNLAAVAYLICSLWLSEEVPSRATKKGEDSKESLQRKRTELLASLSDDIRAPVATIIDGAELAMEGDLDYAQRKQLVHIHASAESLQSLVNDILDLAAVDLGRMVLRPVEFSFRPVLEQLLEPYVRQLQLQSRSLSFHIQSRVPEAMRGDAERLRYVLQSLLENLIEATKGDIVLRVSVRSREQDAVEILFNFVGQSPSSETHAWRELAELQQGDVSPVSNKNPSIILSQHIVGLFQGNVNSVATEGEAIQLNLGVRLEAGAASIAPSMQRTQLGLIPDLPVLVLHEDNEEGSDLQSRLIRWQTEPTFTSTVEGMWETLEKERVSGVPFGLIMLDVAVPNVDPFELCRSLKSNQLYSAVPVIVLTDGDSPTEAARAEAAGASTHLCKPIKSSRLAKSIVTAVLGKGRFRQLSKDLGAADHYVRSLIPDPTVEPLKIDWRYIPAADLAGDSLGFHWIDEDHCAFYLIDVCGHGLDASLLSVSVLNVLKSMTLPQTDFRKPAEVLAQLNDRFPMESHGDRCFSAWYGVFDRKESILRWAGGGHPPALLIMNPTGTSENEAVPQVVELDSKGPLIGMLQEMEFPVGECEAREGASLFVYSDGVFEIENPNGEQSTFEEFVDYLKHHSGNEHPVLDSLWQRARDLRGMDALDDDFTILKVQF